jgi:selenocysteine lyase/cysteine desulfurase
MALDRRTFLARAGLTAAATGLLSRSSAAGPVLAAATGDLDWSAIRALFNLSPDWIHLACFYLVSHPKPVREAIDEYRRRLDANPMWLEEVMFANGHEHMQDRLKAAASLGCDFFVAGTHKWIFGPRGTGLVWGRADAWPHTRPTIPSFDSLEPFGRWAADQPLEPRTQAAWVSPGGFCAFEHYWAVEAAFRLHEQLGRARVAARIAELNGRFRSEMARMKHVTLHTAVAPELSAGIVCFEVSGLTPAQVVERLKARRIVASTSPYAVSYARVAAGIMVSPEEVETTLREIRALSA